MKALEDYWFGDVALAPWAIIIVDTWMWTPFVMLICLAGLRSIPESIYEAAECDRASKWRQFWTITVPMVTALGVGLASSIRGRNPMIDGFGLIALASLTPMFFVMLYGMLR